VHLAWTREQVALGFGDTGADLDLDYITDDLVEVSGSVFVRSVTGTVEAHLGLNVRLAGSAHSVRLARMVGRNNVSGLSPKSS
jgi:hypothetical protein